MHSSRIWGIKKELLWIGSDIGTVVFPKAELKIFMTADNAIRVQRRFKELFAKNPNVTIEEVEKQPGAEGLYRLSHREVSPLRKADDALELDNTNLTEKEQFKLALDWVLSLKNKKG